MINPSAMNFIEEQLYVNEPEVRQPRSPPVIDVEGNEDSEENEDSDENDESEDSANDQDAEPSSVPPIPGD